MQIELVELRTLGAGTKTALDCQYLLEFECGEESESEGKS